LLSLLQDESKEYPTKISLDSEIQVEEFLPLLYKTYGMFIALIRYHVLVMLGYPDYI